MKSLWDYLEDVSYDSWREWLDRLIGCLTLAIALFLLIFLMMMLIQRLV